MKLTKGKVVDLTKVKVEDRQSQRSKLYLINRGGHKYDPCIIPIVQAPSWYIPKKLDENMGEESLSQDEMEESEEMQIGDLFKNEKKEEQSKVKVIDVDADDKMMEGHRQKKPIEVQQHQQQICISQDNIEVAWNEKQIDSNLIKETTPEKEQKQPIRPPQNQMTSTIFYQPPQEIPFFLESPYQMQQLNDYQICKNLIKAVVNMRMDLEVAKSIVYMMKKWRKRPLDRNTGLAPQNKKKQSNAPRVKTPKRTMRRFQKLMSSKSAQEQACSIQKQ